MSSFEIESKRLGHALQMDEKVDVIFWVLWFRVRWERWPTRAEVRDWWRDYGG